MSDFTVAYSNGKTESYTGDSTYTIGDSGILTIRTKGRDLTLSQAGWLCVDESTPKSAYEDHDLITI